MADIDPEALLASIDERIAAHVAPLAEGFNALTERVGSLHDLTQADRAVLNEVAGSSRQMRAELATVFDVTLPTEEREAARARINAQLAGEDAQAESKAAKAKLERLEAEVAATAAKAAQKPVEKPVDLRQKTTEEYVRYMQKPLERFATAQDIDFEEVTRHPDYPKFVNRLPNGNNDWDTFDREARAVIVKVSDEKHAAANASRMELETTRSSGGGRGDEYDNYLAALREGKPLPPPAEIDRILAARVR